MWLTERSHSAATVERRKLTLEKAYDTAHSMEEAQRQATKLQTSANVTADWNLQYMGRGHTPPDVEPPKTTNPPGYRCSKIGHSLESCFQKCRACKKYGHIAKMCRATTVTSRHKAHFVEQGGRVTPAQDSRGEELPLLNIRMVRPRAASTGGSFDWRDSTSHGIGYHDICLHHI